MLINNFMNIFGSLSAKYLHVTYRSGILGGITNQISLILQGTYTESLTWRHFNVEQFNVWLLRLAPHKLSHVELLCFINHHKKIYVCHILQSV